MRYLFNGEEVTTEDLDRGDGAISACLVGRCRRTGGGLRHQSVALDALTCMEYWDMMGIGGVLRAVLEVAVLTEFGQAPSQISALHFVEDLPQVQDGSTASEGTERYNFRRRDAVPGAGHGGGPGWNRRRPTHHRRATGRCSESGPRLCPRI